MGIKENLYDIVDSGVWTLDTMLTLIREDMSTSTETCFSAIADHWNFCLSHV